MEGTERGIIKGHQTIIEALRRTGRNVMLTTILFDHDTVIVCDGKRILTDEIKKSNTCPAAAPPFMTLGVPQSPI